MDLIVLSDWLSNVLVEEIHDTLEKRTIEVKFLLPFAEIRHVSLWQTFRNSVLFKLFSVEKTRAVTIHLAKSTMEVAPSYVLSASVSIQRFSSSRLQHDPGGHAGVKPRKLRMWMRTDVVQSLTLCRSSHLRWDTHAV